MNPLSIFTRLEAMRNRRPLGVCAGNYRSWAVIFSEEKIQIFRGASPGHQGRNWINRQYIAQSKFVPLARTQFDQFPPKRWLRRMDVQFIEG